MESRKYTCDTGHVPRPATGVTPVRNLRVKDEIWEPALAKARAEGKTITEVIVAALKAYIDNAPNINAEPEAVNVRHLALDTVSRAAQIAANLHDDGWPERVLAGRPSNERERIYVLVEAGLADGTLKKADLD